MEYIERYKQRGNKSGFVDFIAHHWDEFIKDIDAETFPTKIKLKPGQYLKDVCLIEVRRYNPGQDPDTVEPFFLNKLAYTEEEHTQLREALSYIGGA
jgi:hypothetical protein